MKEIRRGEGFFGVARNNRLVGLLTPEFRSLPIHRFFHISRFVSNSEARMNSANLNIPIGFSAVYSLASLVYPFQSELVDAYGKMTYTVFKGWNGGTDMASLANNRKSATASSERLEARISPEQKLFFQRAAALRGVTLTDFLIDSLQAAALRAVEEHDVLKLSLQDKRTFVDALMSPPAPNAALKRAAERYRRMRNR